MTLSFTHKHEPWLYREFLYSRHSKFIHINDGCVWIETVKILTLKYQNKKERSIFKFRRQHLFPGINDAYLLLDKLDSI